MKKKFLFLVIFLNGVTVFTDDIYKINDKDTKVLWYENVKYNENTRKVTFHNAAPITIPKTTRISVTPKDVNWPSVAVVQNPEIKSFNASNLKIYKGDKINLSWEISGNATSIKIDPDVGEFTKLIDEKELAPTKTTKYKLTVYKNGKKVLSPKPQELTVTVDFKPKVIAVVRLQNEPEDSTNINDERYGFQEHGKLIWKLKLKLEDGPENCIIKYQIRSKEGEGDEHTQGSDWAKTKNEDTPISGIKVWLDNCPNGWNINTKVHNRPSGTGADGYWSDWSCDNKSGGRWVNGIQITGLKFKISQNDQCLK